MNKSQYSHSPVPPYRAILPLKPVLLLPPSLSLALLWFLFSLHFFPFTPSFPPVVLGPGLLLSFILSLALSCPCIMCVAPWCVCSSLTGSLYQAGVRECYSVGELQVCRDQDGLAINMHSCFNYYSHIISNEARHKISLK